MNRDELIAIMVADHERYRSRQAIEDAILSNDSESRAALPDWSCERPLIKGLGSVTPPRKYPNRAPRSRTHGAAAMPRTPSEHEQLASGDLEPTVLCYNVNDPENVTVRTVREIRSKDRAPSTPTPAQAVELPETARIGNVPGMDWSE